MREPSLLRHGVLQPVEAHIHLADIEPEVGEGDDQQGSNQATEPARSAPGRHHCDCAPSMMSLTIRSSACFRPAGSDRSAYSPSACNPARSKRVFPVV